MKLPVGATGFGSASTDRDDSLRTFAAVCHHAARRTGGTVTGRTPAGVTPNFHTILIGYDHHQIAVVRHTVLPLTAFTSPPLPGDTALAFIDHPELVVAIAEVSDLQVLTVSELQTPLSRTDLTALTKSEHDQINYWKPNTVGDLLFNFWD